MLNDYHKELIELSQRYVEEYKKQGAEISELIKQAIPYLYQFVEKHSAMMETEVAIERLHAKLETEEKEAEDKGFLQFKTMLQNLCEEPDKACCDDEQK